MEQELPEEVATSQPLETEVSSEMEMQAINGLPEALGFVETAELHEVRGQLVEAMAAGAETVPELATRYHLLAEAVVNQQQDEAFAKAQIGLIVQMGLIKRDGGRPDDYVEDLRDALYYAGNMGLEEIVPTLDFVISATSLLSYMETEGMIEVKRVSVTSSEQLAQACGEVIPAEDCEELGAMPLHEAMGYAFTLLIKNGVEDPEEFLKAKGVLE